MRSPKRLIENRTAVEKIMASMKWGWPASLLPVRSFGWFEGKFAFVPESGLEIVSITTLWLKNSGAERLRGLMAQHCCYLPCLDIFYYRYLHIFWAHVNSYIIRQNIDGFGKEKCLCVFHHAFPSSVAVDFILLYLGLFFLMAISLHPLHSAPVPLSCLLTLPISYSLPFLK